MGEAAKRDYMVSSVAEGTPGEEVRLRLKETRECLDAMLLAVEKAADDLWLQPILMRIIAREFVHTFARIQGLPIGLSRAEPLEAAKAMRDWLRSHIIFQGEQHSVEPKGPGVHIVVDGNCAHAARCREQISRGFPLACQRAVEYEAGVNERLEDPLWIQGRNLDPGHECSFDLQPLRALLLEGLESPP